MERSWFAFGITWTVTYDNKATLSLYIYRERERERNLGEGNGTPLQYSCLENNMDGGAW